MANSISEQLGENIFFGKNLRLIRRNWNNLSQSQFANLMGVKQGSVEQYENDRAMARIPALRKLSLLCNVSIDDLIFRELLIEDVPEAPLLKNKKISKSGGAPSQRGGGEQVGYNELVIEVFELKKRMEKLEKLNKKATI